MAEKRKDKRLELESEIVIKRLDVNDKQSQTKAKISIRDVSKSGIGFNCDFQLAIGSVYECLLTIWTKETIHCFVEIVRSNVVEDGFFYGGIFIGMPEADMNRIQVYETFHENADDL